MEESEQSIEISTQNLLIIDNKNGNIDINGSDTAKQILVKIIKKVRDKNLEEAKSHIKDITITQQVDKDRVCFKVDYPSSHRRNYQVDFDIVLPDLFNIISKLGNGNISLKRIISKNIDLDLGNGNITTEITLIDSGNVEINAGNGNVSFGINKDANAKIRASIGNGKISCSGLELKEMKLSQNYLQGILGKGSSQVEMSLGNGNLELKGE